MIVVCSLKDLETVCESIKPSHLISVIDPGYAPKTPKNVGKHLKLGFDDILEINPSNHMFRLNTEEVPQLPPNNDHVNSIAEFTNTWDEENPIVIHCWCGVSRSMATATYLMCKKNNTNIDRNIKYIRHIAPHANPNTLLLSLFEKSLHADSQISSAYKKYPHTKSYDCAINFAPITIFDINDMKNFS